MSFMGFSQTKNNKSSLKQKVLTDSTTGITYFCFDARTQAKVIARKIVIADSSTVLMERKDSINSVLKQENILLDSLNKENSKEIADLLIIVGNQKQQISDLTSALALSQGESADLKKQNQANIKKLKASNKLNVVLGVTTAVSVAIAAVFIIFVH